MACFLVNLISQRTASTVSDLAPWSLAAQGAERRDT
jgi:hypothetical protein